MELVRPDGQLVNGSASQRAIAGLQQTIADLEGHLTNERREINHLRSHLAVMTYNAGGSVTLRVADVKHTYQVGITMSDDKATVTWTATRLPDETEEPTPAV